MTCRKNKFPSNIPLLYCFWKVYPKTRRSLKVLNYGYNREAIDVTLSMNNVLHDQAFYYARLNKTFFTDINKIEKAINMNTKNTILCIILYICINLMLYTHLWVSHLWIQTNTVIISKLILVWMCRFMKADCGE